MEPEIEADLIVAVRQLLAIENPNWPVYVRQQFAETRKVFNKWLEQIGEKENGN